MIKSPVFSRNSEVLCGLCWGELGVKEGGLCQGVFVCAKGRFGEERWARAGV